VVNPILATKLYLPLIRPEANLVPRPRLVKRLNAGQSGRLSLISAPAGFGKTTLVSSWINQLRAIPDNPHIIFTWLSLDETDNNPTRFLAYLTAALQQFNPTIGQTVQSLLKNLELPAYNTIITTLINDIITAITDTVPQFTLILDDMQVVTAQPIHDMLIFLLDHLPPAMQLIILTRVDPPWPLARWRVQGQLIELRHADLRFTIDEVTDFLNRVMGLNLSPEHIATLDARTEGWVAGLQLAALSLQGSPVEQQQQFIKAFAGSNRYVMDYLIDEVLNQQSEPIRRFLTDTAILKRLCSSLCDAVLNANDSKNSFPSQPILEQLEQANLFLIPLDDQRHWYRYHKLFAECLQHRLRQFQPSHTLATLHQRASQWYEAHDFTTEAVEHALLANDMARAADLVEQSAHQLFMQGTMATLTGWLDLFPDELIHTRLWLTIFRAWALYFRRHLTQIPPLLTRVETTLSQQPQTIEYQTMLGHLTTMRAGMAFAQEQVLQTTTLAEQAMTYLPEGDFARGLNALLLADGHRLQGDLPQAKEVFQEAYKVGQQFDNLYLMVASQCRWGYVHLLQGQLSQAVDIYQRALALAIEPNGRPLPLAGYPYLHLSDVLREWNELPTATDYLVKGIDLCKQIGHIGALMSGYVILALVKQAQGDLAGAALAYQEAIQVSPNKNGIPRLTRWLNERQVRLWLAQGDLATAVQWAEESGLQIDDDLDFAHGLAHITLARVLVAQGSHQHNPKALTKAHVLLSRLQTMTEDAGWIDKTIEVLILQALAYQAQGKTRTALTKLSTALTLAEPGRYVRIFVDEGASLATLLKALPYKPHLNPYINKLQTAFSSALTTPQLSKEKALIEPLSPRELEVLRLIAAGLRNKEIATHLMVSPNTIAFHTKNIYGKLNVHNRTQATAKAKTLHLLTDVTQL